jgi:hypothetical protein
MRFAGTGGLQLAMTLMVIAVMLAPGVAKANLEEGHPEAYSGGVRMSTSKVGVIGWGPIHWGSEALGANIECVQMFFGYLHNEGVPAFGRGQILGWSAQGDATRAGQSTRASCKFTKTGVEGEPEAWITDEPPIETTRTGPLSVPWNMQYVCLESEAVRHPFLRVGIPAGAPPPTVGCATEAERVAEIAAEEEARTGCYATAVPEGCVKLTWIIPSLGLEWTFEGTEQVRWFNPGGPAVHPAVWALEETPPLGKLHLRGAFSTTAGPPSGSGNAVGGQMQQIMAK